MACPRSDACVFHRTVEPSILKRVRYASAYVYCNGGDHESCAIRGLLEQGDAVPRNLMPDGSIGDYLESEHRAAAEKFLIIEDSPVFAALASTAIATNFLGAEVVRHHSLEAALDELAKEWSAVVCGFGVGNGKTAHDVRRHTGSPMVILTGRPDHIDLPSGARRVNKGEGPEALVSAIRASLGYGG